MDNAKDFLRGVQFGMGLCVDSEVIDGVIEHIVIYHNGTERELFDSFVQHVIHLNEGIRDG